MEGRRWRCVGQDIAAVGTTGFRLFTPAIGRWPEGMWRAFPAIGNPLHDWNLDMVRMTMVKLGIGVVLRTATI